MTRLILASQSKARQEMLRGAGIKYEAIPANLDETKIINDMQRDNVNIKEIALNLARAKALYLSKINPDALVIGSDQILDFKGKIVEKSLDEDGAITKLKEMAGQSHHLISAVSLARDSEIIWSAHDSATLTMNDLSDDFLQHYKQHAGEALTSSVGGYWLEDIGSWLFEKIEGNYFTILGMPLLPLLNELRTNHKIRWQV